MVVIPAFFILVTTLLKVMAGTGDINIAGNKFEGFKVNANDAIKFKLVRKPDDLFDEGLEFQPDMTHQLFGDSESIFGYQDLKVEIVCTAASMETMVNIKFTDQVTAEKHGGIIADNIMKVLSAHLQPGFYTNQDEFLACLSKEASFQPFGELIHCYNITKEGSAPREFQIYKHTIEEPRFREFHERIQPFLLFYVDAASYIDVDDHRWDFYMLYEKYQSSESNNPAYAFAGYMTVYKYYAYPEKVRPRISQVLVLPPFQRMGHGATLVQTFYNDCYTRAEILDITVEDPSENFQRVRDFVDTRNCLKLDCFSPENLRQGFTEEMVVACRDKLKLNKKQIRRIYEILRLHATDCSNKEAFTNYRLEIKKRLNIPFQKNGRDFAKLKRALNSNELAATMTNLTLEQRLEFLDKEFEETLDCYRQVLDRLAAS